MARNIKKLPKWAIKQAGGINKKAWALARRGRPSSKKPAGKKNKRRKSVAKKSNPRKPMGIVGKINAVTRGIKLGLPAIGSIQGRGLNENTARDVLVRYSGYDIKENKINEGAAKTAVGFYAGNIIESKTLSAMRIPQMAGRKKLLSVVAQYLPEIQTIPRVVEGNFEAAANDYGRLSIGYDPGQNRSIADGGNNLRDFLGNLAGRAVLGGISRFVGPMVNKHLPKGVNI